MDLGVDRIWLYSLFTKAIIENRPIDVFNNGNMMRDFTYIDDIVEGVIRIIDNPYQIRDPTWSGSTPKPNSSPNPYKIYNIGNQSPVKLMDFIQAIEKSLGKQAVKNMLPLQAGDVPSTFAEVSDLVSDLNYKPDTSIEYGIEQFINWYKSYFRVEHVE